MTPPVLSDVLRALDAWLLDTAPLLQADPDEWVRRLERFVTFAVSMGYRSGCLAWWVRLQQPREH